MSKKFNKSALLAALKPKMSSVEIDGFGLVNIKQLAVTEVDSVRAKLKQDKDKDESFGLRLVILSVFDDEGAPAFNDDDLPEIKASSNEAVEKLVAKVLELNGFRKAEAGN